jgi:hypothetical protein
MGKDKAPVDVIMFDWTDCGWEQVPGTGWRLQGIVKGKAATLDFTKAGVILSIEGRGKVAGFPSFQHCYNPRKCLGWLYSNEWLTRIHSTTGEWPVPEDRDYAL